MPFKLWILEWPSGSIRLNDFTHAPAAVVAIKRIISDEIAALFVDGLNVAYDLLSQFECRFFRASIEIDGDSHLAFDEA